MSREENVFFTEFYREHFESLCSYAYRFVTNWDDARDITQDAFKTALTKFDDFYSSENPIGWMKETIHKLSANFNKVQNLHNSRTEPLDEKILVPAVSQSYESGEDSAIALCAELLSPEEFSMIQDTIIANEPYSTAYKKSGLSYEAFWKRIYRILQKLRNHWNT